jgi:hypothetical protein
MASPKNVFIDTNVLMDVLIQREPFYMASAQIWSLAEKGIVCGLISVISFNNSPSFSAFGGTAFRLTIFD